MNPEGASANPAGAAVPLLNDRYELGERLAEGPFFYTHRGRDTQTGKAIAIKVLRPEFAGDEPFANRLLSEAQSAVNLQHPNIAETYNAWRERGTVVIAAEWVRGINLKDRIRRVAPFPLAVAMDILLAGTEALNYAHEHGFVHGDMRPDNIIITPEGRVKITDFGLGASVAASSRIQLNALPRAVSYLAPELIEGKGTEASTDIYSLGCVLYEMLSGSVPFAGETPLAIAAKHLHQPAPSLQQANPQVPNAVDGIARKCMQKDPLTRYLTAQALLQDIQKVREALRTDQPLTWSPVAPQVEKPSVPERTKSRARKKERREERQDTGPSSLLLISLLVLAILMVVGFSFGLSMMVFNNPFGAPKSVTVPSDLVGKNQDVATSELKSLGLTADIRPEFSDRPEGVVFETAPKGGVEMRSGRPVALYVSKGSEPVSVPDVVGKSRSKAQRAIEAAGLINGDVKEEYSEVYSKGDVISQTPPAQTDAKKKSSVSLVVSKGPEPVTPTASSDSGMDNGNDQTGDNTDNGGDNGDTTGNTPSGAQPNPDLPAREHEVTIRVPRTARGAQTVKIVVRNEDGTEQTVYEQEHQPGEEFKQTVATMGAKGKCQIRVYLNGTQIYRMNV